MTPPVFIFVGHSGSGKTTLIEKLLRELSGRGLRVATIKHAHHRVRLGHVTDETTSHSTRPSKDDGQVAGYAEQPIAGTAAGNPLPHQTLARTVSGLRLGHVTDETTSHSTRPSKDDGQVAGYAEQPIAGTAAGNPLPHQTLARTVSGLQLDTPGKDSWRYRQAGAAISMLVTSDELQLVADAVDRREPEQLAQRFLGEADLVLAEGFSHASGAKIEVLRRACSAVPRCAIEDGLIAMVTDVDEVYPQLPHFSPDDIDGIVRFMLERE
ncbi:MAG: molybdopterin-guanine dinucleotide biosynthesis protein B [Gallionella sp.]